MSERFETLTEELHLCRNSMISTDYGIQVRSKSINSYICSEDNEDFADNLTNLEDKTPENVAAYLRRKFLSRRIYMWAGQALLVLHPYCDIKYEKISNTAPGIGAVVEKSWFNLTNNLGKQNQCLVISGDSGSGKTYSACLAIKAIADKVENTQDIEKNNILSQAWSHVPLLTAFGNASTIYNYNSSRFGKLLQMQYKDGRIIGAYIQTYMLEKSRVSGPNRGESNFHIFSQILEHVDEETLSQFCLTKSTIYKICPLSEKSKPMMYEETLKSMTLFQITNMDEILKTISIILNLGNIEFVNIYDKLNISNESTEYLQNCGKLLECDTTKLLRLFLKRLIAAKLRRATICYTSCLNTEECEERRDAFMRYLYEKLFLWLVKCINDKINTEQESKLIGILDIYGFEAFRYNTFEQLCINYANERLQEYFVKNYIVNQQNVFNEDLDTAICRREMTEYTTRIALLDGTPSVFGILNEECLVKRYNTDVFICGRLSSILRKYPHFIERGNSLSTTFSIIHYAGPVEYDCRTMVSKNRDKVPEEMITFLKECKFNFFSQILADDCVQDGIQGKTLLTKFKKSLDKLMNTLNESHVHYIKCLKPNLHQFSGFFDDSYVISQLKYNGLMDILNLDLQNYPIVLETADFISKFTTIHDVLEEFKEVLQDKIHVTEKIIYLTKSGYEKLSLVKNLHENFMAIKIQNVWRKYIKRRNCAREKLKKCATIIQLRRAERKIYLPQRKSDKSVENLGRNFLGDPLSFKLEKLLKNTEVNSFERLYFRNQNMISRFKLPELPIRLHLRKTCIPYSTVIPITELPQGLADIL